MNYVALLRALADTFEAMELMQVDTVAEVIEDAQPEPIQEPAAAVEAAEPTEVAQEVETVAEVEPEPQKAAADTFNERLAAAMKILKEGKTNA